MQHCLPTLSSPSLPFLRRLSAAAAVFFLCSAPSSSVQGLKATRNVANVQGLLTGGDAATVMPAAVVVRGKRWVHVIACLLPAGAAARVRLLIPSSLNRPAAPPSRFDRLLLCPRKRPRKVGWRGFRGTTRVHRASL